MESNALNYFNSELIKEHAALIATHEELKKEYEVKVSSLEKSIDTLSRDVEYYKGCNDFFRRQLFGKKSEKRKLPESIYEALHLPGFGDEERPKPPESDPKTEKIEYTRKKPSGQGTRGNRSTRFPEWMRRVIEEVPPLSTSCPCCNKEMEKTSKIEKSEKLCCTRDPFYVKEYHRYMYKCTECQTVDNLPTLPDVFERSLFDHTAVGAFILNKFLYGLPFYRQGNMIRDIEIKVSDDSVLRVSNQGLELLTPIYTENNLSVLSSEVLIGDDTRLQAGVGKVKKKLPSYKRGCLWGMYGDKDEVSYVFSPSRTHTSCKDVLAGFQGYLVVDGYDGFEKVAETEGVTLVNCNNHARRKYVSAENSDKKRAEEALAFYSVLYRIENECKDFSSEKKKEYRQKFAAPVLENLKEWVEVVGQTAEAKSPLGRACKYVGKRWASLTEYLNDGRLPFDTMDLERSFRVVAVSRKNFLHASSEAGAQAAAIAFSLINTCLLQGVDPFLFISVTLWIVLPERKPRQHS